MQFRGIAVVFAEDEGEAVVGMAEGECLEVELRDEEQAVRRGCYGCVGCGVGGGIGCRGGLFKESDAVVKVEVGAEEVHHRRTDVRVNGFAGELPAYCLGEGPQ